MDTKTQLDRLTELTILHRAQLKELAEQLPGLREEIVAEFERRMDEAEPQFREELEAFAAAKTTEQVDAHALRLKSEIDTIANEAQKNISEKVTLLIAQKQAVAELVQRTKLELKATLASVPESVQQIVGIEAEAIRTETKEQLRTHFETPRFLNPRGVWKRDEVYEKLDLVSSDGSSYVANERSQGVKPGASKAEWTTIARRGSAGALPVTSLGEIVGTPTDGEILIGDSGNFVRANLTAGYGINIITGPGSIQIETAGFVIFEGTWNANTNTPALASGVGVAGHYYVVSTAGTTNLDGITDWQPGDWVIFNGTAWEKVDNSEIITSVNGQTGVVVLTKSDVGLGNVTDDAQLTIANNLSDLNNTATARTNLGVAIGSDVQAHDADLDSWAGVTRASGFDTFAATPSSANLASLVTDETGSGALVFANSPTLVTPALGTPASGIATNLTGTAAGLTAGNVTTNANLTGDVTSVGNATSIAAGVIVDADINASAAIVDTKLATIATSGKVSNSATTATSANTASAIVARDGSGDFSAGTITANLTGNVSGSSGSTTGNAATATALQTARAINGVNFDGTAPITVTADAGTLTGATLTSGVTASSLTSLGTIANLTATAGTIATTPSASTDIANKLYVDTVAQGLDAKASCLAATTADITLSGAQTIDGVSVVAGNRVLVKNQNAPENNGIYLCASGSWTRTTDADTWDELTSAFTFIEQGTTNADTGYVCTANAGGTLGTTALPWSQFSGAGTFTAGTGLTLTGSVFSLTSPVAVANGGTGLTSLGSGVATFLGTPSSANLAAAVSDETGSGALVFASSPTLVTPTLGAATATSINGVTVTGTSTPALSVTGTTAVSGTNTGDQTTITGNAGTATVLQTARNINGVSFDGSADITVAAAAGTLTGATLAAGVTASSLTSLGTIASLTATSLTVNDNTTLGSSNSDTVNFNARVASDINPATDNTYDLGVTGHEWRNLNIDGTANIDSLVADTADINGGTIDGTTIGAGTPSTIAATTGTFSGALNQSSSDPFAPQFIQTGSSADGFGSYFIVQKNRGGATVQANDIIGNILFQGWDGSAYDNSAYIAASVASVSSGHVQGQLNFVTLDSAGTEAARAIITSTGLNSTAIGATTPSTGAFTTLNMTGFSFSSSSNNLLMQGTDGVIYRSGGSGTNAGIHRFRYFDTDVAVVTSTGVAVTGTLSSTGAATFTAGSNAIVVNNSGGDSRMAFQDNATTRMILGISASTDSIITGSVDGSPVFRWNTGSALFSADDGTTAHFGISSTGVAVTGAITSTSTGNTFTYSGSGEGLSLLNSTDTSGSLFLGFRKANATLIGSVSRVTTTDVVAFNTTSDGRLKTNVRDFTAADSGRIIDGLKPRWFDWKNSDENGKGIIGFIAQEEHAVDSALARMGAVTVGDDDPETVTKQWAVDSGKLVPVLVAELKSVRARLAALESK
jgi:hypothetical protein